MRHVGSLLLMVGLAAGCTRARPRVAPVGPASAAAPGECAGLAELRRTLADTAQLGEVRRLTADSATVAELRQTLADTARTAELRRLMVDTAWLAHVRPQIAELQAEVARLSRCPGG